MMSLPVYAAGRRGPGRPFVRPPRRRRARAGRPLAIEMLESRRCPSASAGLLAAAVSLGADPNVGLTGQLAGSASTDLYHVSVDSGGLLTAQVHPLGFGSRLSLLDGQGNLLIESEASSPQNPDDHVALHVIPGDYFLMVQGLSGGGTFQLSTSFTAANPLSQPLTSYSGSYSVAVANLVRGSNVPDAVIADFYDNQVLVDIGLGDGTFRPPVAIPVGLNPAFVTTADLTGNGIPDIITANTGSGDISILLGNGDGTFQAPVEIPVGFEPSSVAVGDFTGGGRLDLAVVNSLADSVQILLGNGDGTFTRGLAIPTGQYPTSVTAGDFTGDGRLDLAVASAVSATVSIFVGNGDGTFAPGQQIALPAGSSPTSLVAADFHGCGRPDLAVACAGDNTVRVFLNQRGSFVPSQVLQGSTYPYTLVAADFTGNGQLDLAASSYGAGDVSIFLGNGDGTFRAAENIAVGAATMGLAAADLTGSGRADILATDLITGDVSILLGNGDGTFQAPSQPLVPTANPTVVSADLTGNGIQDLIVPDYSADNVSILMGRGDGTFRAPILVPTGLGPWGVAVGDFTGNGILDLAVTNRIEDSISILLGNGDGTFRPGETMITGIQPSYITAADLTGNGHLDLVESDYLTQTISIFYGRGDGTFAGPVMLPAGGSPGNPVVADFCGGGRPDIAVAVNQSLVALFRPAGPGTYGPARYFPAGPGADFLAAGDLNGDGRPDLVVADSGSYPSYATVLINNGDGTFTPGPPVPVGPLPFALSLADLTGNGKLDIIAGSLVAHDITVAMGNGDGTFGPPIAVPVGRPTQFALAVADFNGDSRPDIAAVIYQTGTVDLLFNQGDGTFGPAQTIPTAVTQVALVSASFTDDGRLDLAVANPLQGTVTIEFGNGDGTFTIGQTIQVGADPSGLVAADFNGDGNIDLAVACAGSDEVVVLLGMGDGTFGDPIALPVGKSPHAIVAGDFFHDGVTDIAVADEVSGDVAVLIGRGDGTFLPARTYPVGTEPVALVAADLGGNGEEDLVTANRTSGDLTVLWTLPGGGFSAQTVQYGGHAPSALAAADFNGDGRIDLAVADERDQTVTVLLSLGGGAFAPFAPIDIGLAADFLQAIHDPRIGPTFGLAAADFGTQDAGVVTLGSDGSPADWTPLSLGLQPVGMAIADFNDNGLMGIAVVTSSSNRVTVELGVNTSQELATQVPVPRPQPAPVIVDWNGDGMPDVFTLDQQGRLLMRAAQPGSPGEFGSAQVIDVGAGVRFRDIVSVRTRYGTILAALDASQPVVWLIGQADGPGATVEVQSVPVPGASYLVSMASGDLRRNGLDDLVLVDRGSNQVIVLGQAADGSFAEIGPPLAVGYAPSDAAIVDLTGGGWPDLVVSNTYSGDLSVFYGGPTGFSPEVRLAGGLGAAELVAQGGALVRNTNDEPIGVAAGVFGASGLTDVVSVQSGADRISLLEGTPGGGLADPSLATSYPTGIDPTQVVAAPLTADGLTDLVVLNQGSNDISIFLNNGQGGFVAMPRVDAGNGPTGLAVRDVNGDGIPDLLVSNAQGDLLIIVGKGDGTFEPYQRADQGVSLALGDFSGKGQTEYVLSNMSIDQLSVQYGETQSFVQGRSQGIQAPGAVAVADLNGDGNPDILVLNSGENDMLVYLGLGGNRFAAPLRFFTGTDPVGLTVADLAGDGIPDIVVANAGSDDLSVFIGVGQGGGWTLQPRPRLPVGADPVSTTVADVYGDGIPDIISVDQGSDDITVLRGVGGGFFDDRNPLVLPAGPGPIRAFVGKFDAAAGPDLAVLDAGSSDLTYYSNFAAGTAVRQLIPTGDPNPVAGVMGSYGIDGFADLFIAHQGDSRIALLDGGPRGLVLTEFFDVGQPVQPTDLAISGGPSGSIQLYIATAGEGQVILLNVSVGIASPIVGPTGGSPIPATAMAQSIAGRGAFLSTPGGLLTLEEASTETQSQVQASTQAETTSTAGTGVSAQVTVATGGIGLALPQIITSSIAPLTLLVNNLVQVGQVQVSDLMPLDHSALDAVAVLIMVSGAPGEEALDQPVGLPEETRTSPAMRVGPSSPGGAGLEHYLSDIDDALNDVPRAVLASGVEPGGSWPDWVWQPGGAGSTDAAGPPVPGASAPPSSVPSAPPSPSTAAPAAESPDASTDFAAILAFDGAAARPGSPAGAESILAGWARPLAGALLISSLAFAGRSVWARKRAGRSHPNDPRASSAGFLRPPHRAETSASPRARADRDQDLPPWLAEPSPRRWTSKG